MRSASHHGSGTTFLAPKRRLPIGRRTTHGPLDLRGADLRQKDLRGLDFTGANMRGADLRYARTGMRASWAFTLGAGSLVLAILVGAASGVAGNFLQQLITSREPTQRMLGVFVAAELVVFIAAAIWKGIREASIWLLPPLAALVVAGMMVGISTGGTGVGALAILALSALILALLVLGVLARVVAGTASALLFTVVAVSGALAGRELGGGLTAVALAMGAMLIGRRTLREGAGSPLLRAWSVTISCAGGTSFRHADLRGARFEGAELEHSDFRGAQLDDPHVQGATVHLCAFDPQAPASRSADDE